MPRPVKMADEDVESSLASIPGWTIENGKLHRDYQFADFAHAFGFMAAVATVAEKKNHHPDWFNVYNRVTVNLVTHDVGGITALDFELALEMEKLAAKLQ